MWPTTMWRLALKWFNVDVQTETDYVRPAWLRPLAQRGSRDCSWSFTHRDTAEPLKACYQGPSDRYPQVPVPMDSFCLDFCLLVGFRWYQQVQKSRIFRQDCSEAFAAPFVAEVNLKGFKNGCWYVSDAIPMNAYECYAWKGSWRQRLDDSQYSLTEEKQEIIGSPFTVGVIVVYLYCTSNLIGFHSSPIESPLNDLGKDPFQWPLKHHEIPLNHQWFFNESPMNHQ